MKTVVSLFSGIGGFDEGFKRAGFETSVYIEKDSNCLELLGQKFINAVSVSDVTQLPAIMRRIQKGLPVYGKWKEIIERIRAASVFCGGFPCQDLSVAGQRAGLAGGRSGLWFVFRRLVALFRPPWVVIENVSGLLSSNGGRDLAIIFCGLEKLGYRWAYRTLDAQYFGLAQRRERVFIVASLGNYGCAEVLFERESLCWDSPPSRETGKRITGTLSARSEGGGGLGSDFEIGGWLVENAQSPTQQQPPRRQRDLHPDAAHCLNGRGGAGRYDGESETFVAHTLRAEGFDASEDGTGLGTPIIPVAARGGLQMKVEKDMTGTLVVEQTQAVCFSCKDHGADAGELAPTLRAGVHDKSHMNGGCPAAVAFTERTRSDGRNFESQEEVSYALTNPGSGGRTHSRQIAANAMVRRLTPTECERLQGFPDGYTADQSDSVRYRQLGNAVAVPVAEWIGKRLMKLL